MEEAKNGDLCLFVLDGSKEISEEEINLINSLSEKSLLIINKSDLEQKAKFETSIKKIFVSAKNGTGIKELKDEIYNAAIKTPASGSELNASASQAQDIREALGAMNEALENEIFEPDIIAGLLNDARISLMRVLGLDVGVELLEFMFNRFCVGK